MQSLIHFILRLNLDFLWVLVILDEYWGIAYECALNRAADFFPRALFVVEIESYSKNDHFVNVYSGEPLHFQSLQIVGATRCCHFQRHFPYADEEFVFSWNIYIVWRIYDQERGIDKIQPELSARQVKQGTFTRSEIAFYWVLVEQGDSLAYASCAFQGQLFDIRLAIPVMGWAGIENSFGLGDHMQVDNIGDDWVIGCVVLHFKPSARVWWSAENSQISLSQS